MSKAKIYVGFGLILLTIAWMFSLPIIGMYYHIPPPFQPIKEIVSPFLIDAKEEKTLLVFWGYVGCSTACPVTLANLQIIYTTYQRDYPGEALGVIFLGLPLPGESLDDLAADRYAKHFHQDFRGYGLSRIALSQALRDFGVIFTPSLASPEQLSHSSFIYLLQKKEDSWVLRRTYTDYPPRLDLILSDLRHLRAGEIGTDIDILVRN